MNCLRFVPVLLCIHAIGCSKGPVEHKVVIEVQRPDRGIGSRIADTEDYKVASKNIDRLFEEAKAAESRKSDNFVAALDEFEKRGGYHSPDSLKWIRPRIEDKPLAEIKPLTAEDKQ